ncbi:sigma factor [Pseudolabrys sp.]|uniref:sigma factor n=1 Tax=Pseudolabrys sp. TaxID=1960880 RepID=UPI003D0D5FB1
MPTPDDSNLNQSLIAFLGGNRRAGDAIYTQMRAAVLAIVRDRAPDLANDREDVLNEIFVLMMEAPHRFDPGRGSARVFITSVILPDAMQRVRAKMARPGTTTRRRKVVEPTREATFPMLYPAPDPETVEVIGYGSLAAMEAACDARVIWSRATPPVRVIIGGLMDGKAQIDIASEMNMDRFKVARMVTTLRQFADAA